MPAFASCCLWLVLEAVALLWGFLLLYLSAAYQRTACGEAVLSLHHAESGLELRCQAAWQAPYLPSHPAGLTVKPSCIHMLVLAHSQLPTQSPPCSFLLVSSLYPQTPTKLCCLVSHLLKIFYLTLPLHEGQSNVGH